MKIFKRESRGQKRKKKETKIRKACRDMVCIKIVYGLLLQPNDCSSTLCTGGCPLSIIICVHTSCK
jgi:hypothetical protein